MTYTPPTTHDLALLYALEAELSERRRLAKAFASDLARIWDRIDAGEQISDKAARIAVAAANDAVTDAEAAWLTEWRRVGKPLRSAA